MSLDQLINFVKEGKLDEIKNILRNEKKPEKKDDNNNNNNNIGLLNCKDKDGRACMHYAAASGNTQVVDVLLLHGASLNVLDNFHGTPFSSSVKFKKLDMAKHLLQKGCDPSIKDVKGHTIIHTFAGKGDIDTLSTLFSFQNQLTQLIDDDGRTPLFSAIKYDCHAVIQLLLKIGGIGGDPSIKDKFGYTAFHFASASGRLQCLKILFENSGKDDVNIVDSSNQTLLYPAIKYNREHIFNYLLSDDKILVNVKDNKGDTPLHLAAKLSSLPFCKKLVSLNSKTNVLNDDGKTPLDLATNYDVIEYLTPLTPRPPSFEKKMSLAMWDDDLTERELSEEEAKNREKEINWVKECMLQEFKPTVSKTRTLTFMNEDTLLMDGATEIHGDDRDPKRIKTLVNICDCATLVDTETTSASETITSPSLNDVLIENTIIQESEIETPLPLKPQPTAILDLNKETPITPQIPPSPITPQNTTPQLHRTPSASEISPRSQSQSPITPQGLHTSVSPQNTARLQHSPSEFNKSASPLTPQFRQSSEISNSSLKLGPLALSCLIDTSTINFSNVIGSGSYGEVFKAKWTGIEVAVKKMHSHLSNVTTATNQFVQEIEFMCRLRHPNIVSYMGCSLEPEVCIVMEYLPYNLSTYISKNGPLPFPLLIKIAKGISNGLLYLHKYAKIIHRDLKPSNILLDANFHPKISDFGVSRDNSGTMTMTGIGTPIMMAPEMLLGRKYGDKVDIYSFGLILWQMFTGEKPFSDLKCSTTNEELSPIQIAVKVAMERKRPIIPASCPKAFSTLIQQCWQHNPNARLSSDDLVKIFSSFEG